jgi:ferredoxin
MKEAVIDKKKTGDLLKAAAVDSQVFAPVRTNAEIEYIRIADGTEDVTLDFSNVKLSPKGVFFPQMETLLTFDYDAVEEIPEPENNIILFGSRPCDALSLLYLDKIFGPENKGYDDPYYLKRRENSVLISLACNDPCSTCFCTSVGGGPADAKGSDILMFDQEEKLYFSAVTEKGEAFLEKHGTLLQQPPAGSAEKAEEQGKKAAADMEVLPVDKEELKKRLDEGFEDVDWDMLTRNCIGCGACTYLCPTCYCFDITDEQLMYKGKRIRTWDACQFPQFTKHASGHNPRNTKLERLRQRFMHKFSYLPENMGEIYCVGCGRCITNCPVNIDIREVIQTFAKK